MRSVEIGVIERLRRAGLLREPSGSRRAKAGDTPNRPRPDLAATLGPDMLENLRDPGDEPILHGARPWRAATWVGPWVLGGKRYPDETVRHLALDLIGDLCLAGAPLLARIVAHRPTHRLAYACVATLMQRPDAWDWWDGSAASDPFRPSLRAS